MDILIYEHFLGEDYKDQLSPLILNEAKLIINTIIKDLSLEYSDSKISLLLNKKNKNLIDCCNCLYRNYHNDVITDISNKIKKNDKVLVLAPEENLIMYDLIKSIEDKQISHLNSSSSFISKSTNKFELNVLLQNSKKYLIKTYKNYEKIRTNNRVVAKIFDGIGAENLFIFKNRYDLEKNKHKLTKFHIFQEYIKGEIIGINIVVKNNKVFILSINEQIYKYSSDHEIFLCKINIGKYNYMLDKFKIFVENILSNLNDSFGFIGIDAILTDDQEIIFLEINPRLTTSYVGLRESLGINPFAFLHKNISSFNIANNKLITLSITK